RPGRWRGRGAGPGPTRGRRVDRGRAGGRRRAGAVTSRREPSGDECAGRSAGPGPAPRRPQTGRRPAAQRRGGVAVGPGCAGCVGEPAGGAVLVGGGVAVGVGGAGWGVASGVAVLVAVGVAVGSTRTRMVTTEPLSSREPSIGWVAKTRPTGASETAS